MRSLLFVPADSGRKLDRARQSGAAAVILDLEDSVVPANRRRREVKRALFWLRADPSVFAVTFASTP